MDALSSLINLRSGISTDNSEMMDGRNILRFSKVQDSEYKFFEKISETIDDIRKNPPDKAELNIIKKQLIKTLKNSFLTNEDLQDVLSDDCLKNDFNYKAKINFISNLSANDILYASNLLDLSKASIQVLHPIGTTQKDLDDGLKEYKNYVTPQNITRQFQKINIKDRMENYNIYPYSNYRVKSAILPNNTRFVAIDNTKDDECRISWEMFNPDLKNFNPTAQLMLDYFNNGLSMEDATLLNNNGIAIYNTYNDNSLIFDVKCNEKNLEEAFNQLRKAMTVDFDETIFEEKKEAVIKDIKSREDRAYRDFIYEKTGNHSFLSKEKLLEQFKRLTFDEVKSYYNALLNNSYSTVCANFPFGPNNETIDKVASGVSTPNFSFRKEDDNKFEKNYKLQEAKCYTKEKPQPNYSLVYKFKTNGNKADSLKFEILTSILNQRIFNTLREKHQLGYTTGAAFDEWGDLGTLKTYIDTSHTDLETIDEIYKLFKEEINRILKEPITLKELKEAKAEIKRNYYDLEDSKYDDENHNWSICDEIRYNLRFPNGLSQMQNNLQIVESITPEDICQAARYIFKDEPDYIIETDGETLKNNEEYFKNLVK